MSTDSREAAVDWGESDDALVLDDDTTAATLRSGAARTKNPGMLAMFGGLYAVWTLAWVLGIAAAPTQQASSLVDAVMFQFGEFLAMVATPLWASVVWWLTSDTSGRWRVFWLLVGLVILFPFPLVLPLLV
jgi:hypothetical protein